MRLSFLEWTMRVTMLVLAGLVTLSILGSIAAISTEAGPGGFIVQRAAPPPSSPGQETEPEPIPPEPTPAPDGNLAAAAGSTGSQAGAAAQPPERPERWLEAIAYALLAISGLLAIAMLFLWRGGRELGRIADALEARPPT